MTFYRVFLKKRWQTTSLSDCFSTANHHNALKHTHTQLLTSCILSSVTSSLTVWWLTDLMYTEQNASPSKFWPSARKWKDLYWSYSGDICITLLVFDRTVKVSHHEYCKLSGTLLWLAHKLDIESERLYLSQGKLCMNLHIICSLCSSPSLPHLHPSSWWPASLKKTGLGEVRTIAD